MDHLTLLNLAAYTLQVVAVVAVGCALPALLRLDAPRVRFAYWRVLVLACLALPWLQARRTMEAAASAGATAALVTTDIGGASADTSVAPAGIPWTLVISAILLFGILLRLLWMAAGLLYLRRLRAAGATAEDDQMRELQTMLRTNADVRYVPGVRQPVTFGVARPVVLLPQALREHDAEIRRAVLTHELVHVRRRDWAWIVVEELVRAALWFNPAMWWLISRVQQAREELVDQQVVAITGKRRTYLEALLAFSDSTPLAPAPAFARRRHLFRRMVLVSKEAVMSSTRIVVSSAVMALVVGAAGWYAVSAFPMQQGAGAVVSQTPGPLEKAAKPITPENPIPRRLQSAQADYPAEAATLQASGTIALRVTLDATGKVAEVRRVSGTVQVGNPPVTLTFTDTVVDGQTRIFLRDGTTAAKPEGAGFKSSQPALEAIDLLTKSAIAAVRQWSYEPPADAPISFGITFRFRSDGQTASAQSLGGGVPGGVIGGVRGGVGGGVGGGISGGVAGGLTATDEINAQGALRVGGNIKPPLKVADVKPVYPPEAQEARVQGVVILEIRIEPDGSVGQARILRSVPILDQAALDAVTQWRFTPTLMNGQPVPVIMTVTVNFTLQ